MVSWLAASMGKRTIVPVLVALRLGMAVEQGWWQSCKTSCMDEEEQRSEQMDLVGRGGGIGAFCGGVGLSGPM